MNQQGERFCQHSRNQLIHGEFSLLKLRQDFGYPTFTDLGMRDEVMDILTKELIISERKTHIFREFFYKKLLGLEKLPKYTDYRMYKKSFTEMLDREIFNIIYAHFFDGIEPTKQLEGGKRMINKDIPFHVFGNMYYLLGALQEARLGDANVSQKDVIKGKKWDIFRIYAGGFEKAKEIYKPHLNNIIVNPHAMREDRNAGKHRGMFSIYYQDGGPPRGIASPSYDRAVGPPAWAVNKSGILPAKEFSPRILEQYIKKNKQAFFDFLEK